jgi:hypothetical protein
VLGDRLSLVVVVPGRPVELDGVVEQPLRQPVRLGLAALTVVERQRPSAGTPSEWDHERLRVRHHPVVLVLGEPSAGYQWVLAAIRPWRALHPAPEDLELIVQHRVPVLDPERRGGPEVCV